MSDLNGDYGETAQKIVCTRGAIPMHDPCMVEGCVIPATRLCDHMLSRGARCDKPLCKYDTYSEPNGRDFCPDHRPLSGSGAHRHIYAERG